MLVNNARVISPGIGRNSQQYLRYVRVDFVKITKAALTILLFCYVVIVPQLFDDSIHDVDFSQARQAPALSHWFGTDYAGRDLFAQVAAGLRMSMLIALLCTLLATTIGVVVGSLAATRGRWTDAVLMRICDATNALPHLLLGIVIVALFRGSILAIVLSIALTHWPQVARIVRAEALRVRHLEYIDAAYLAGASRRYVWYRHIVPAVLPQAFVAIILLLPHAIWHESTLSFLGLGLSPDTASLGTLLQQSRSEVLVGGWWTLVFPAGMLVLITFVVSAIVRFVRVTRLSTGKADWS